MAFQELTLSEVMEVSGGDRNLGTLYQYTGDPSDRTLGEATFGTFLRGFDWVFRELLSDHY